MNKAHNSHLQNMFDDRVSFDRIERKLYGHDIGAMPLLVKPLIGDTLPDAVIQPTTEEELAELVRWASQEQVPLTPRGKATSGYGGVLPVKQGIVVDFYRMKDMLAVDAEENTVTVQPGITWEQLDSRIQKQDLTLRLYPSSYPASTVGGWLAQGGAGIGSYEFGYFRDNVVSARVVLPTGEVREFSGDDLELVSDAEGITGFISQVTLRVQPLEELDVAAVACPDAQSVQGLMQAIVDAELPIWSMLFINPRMAEMKNRAPSPKHHGHPTQERVSLPASYVVTLAFRKSHSADVRAALPAMMKSYEAEMLSDQIAEHEWEHRFKLMVVKRLGPSLVPAEAVVPLNNFEKAMTEIERKIDQPIVKEGIVIPNGDGGKAEVVILGFIPADQRKLSYNFVFSLSLTIMKIAEKYGGRPYSTGFYFSKRADSVLGKARAQKLRDFKAKIDPQDVMNPGKVIGNGLMSTALNAAWTFEPLARPFGNIVNTQVGERPEKPVRDIPPDIAWYAYSCSQCGYCVDECDQFYGRGWESQSPRGKWYWLREYMEGRENWNQQMVDTMLACTTCELCNSRCSAALPIEPSWLQMREQLIAEKKKMTFPPFEMMAEAVQAQGNIWAGYRKDRPGWFPEDLREQHGPEHSSENVYFAGCTASYVENDIGIASVRLLHDAGVDFTYLGEKENCCAVPMLVAGKRDIFIETMKKNIAAVEEAGADTVITSCPACNMMWRHTYPTWAKKAGIECNVSVKHYSEIIAEKLRDGTFTFPDNDMAPITVAWHDSCHIGRVSKVYEQPRDMIKAVPNTTLVEMSTNRENAHCCGSVLTLIKEPDVAAEIGKTRIDEALEVGADKILALCPCCQFQLRVTADKKQLPVEIIDLSHFAAKALGHELPDPHPEVQAQWAVFEAMIELMTPQGFADLMGTMWPEMIDAMPFGMGPMMRVMGKIPGALTLMKPMFPVLFPKLLPMMMPKVMTVMLSRVADRVPMPDYMAEQMPDMMPKVMDNLMPHMIHDVVPLVSQPMIDYLEGNVKKAV